MADLGAAAADITAMVQEGTGEANALQAYQAAFVCMGGLTLASTWVFWQLSPASVMHHSIENETLTQATPD